MASREILNTNLESLPVTARAAGKAGSVPAKGPTVSHSVGRLTPRLPTVLSHSLPLDIVGDAQDAWLRPSFEKVGAMLGPAAWGMLGCE